MGKLGRGRGGCAPLTLLGEALGGGSPPPISIQTRLDALYVILSPQQHILTAWIYHKVAVWALEREAVDTGVRKMTGSMKKVYKKNCIKKPRVNSLYKLLRANTHSIRLMLLIFKTVIRLTLLYGSYKNPW